MINYLIKILFVIFSYNYHNEIFHKNNFNNKDIDSFKNCDSQAIQDCTSIEKYRKKKIILKMCNIGKISILIIFIFIILKEGYLKS